MTLGGLAVSVGLLCIGTGIFIVAYPEALIASSIGAGSSDTERPGGATVRRWAQLRGVFVAAVGLGLIVVGFWSMF